MKTTTSLALLALAVAAPLRFMQDDKAPEDAMAGKDAWARYEKLMKPSKNHKFYEQLIGKWEVETEFVMPGMTMPKTKGSAEYRWLYEGLWLVREASGQMMGKPIKSTTTFGYDNYKKKFVSSTVGAHISNMLNAEGMMDRSKKNIFFYGPMDEPLSDEHDKPVKYALRIIDQDTHVEEVHDLAIGETNTKVISSTYRRVK